MTRALEGALGVIRSAARGRRGRAELPTDRDIELCDGACYEPRMCGTPGKCWVTEVLAKSARLRAALGPPRAALAAFLEAADGHDGEAHGRQLALAAALASFDQARNDRLHVSAESLAADRASHRDDATGGR